MRIHSTCLITVCCLYLPPNAVIHQQDLNILVDQLPAPFVILGDFNGHSTLWDSVQTNSRGRQIEQIAAADLSIPKNSSHSFQRYKPWWNADCQTAYKNQRRLWGIFRRYPTTENLLAFKKAKANALRVRRQSQRKSWIRYVSSLTSSTSSKQLWRKVKAANGIYREFSFPILQTSDSVFSSPVEIANILGETFQSVSSAASYNSRFLEIKRRAERTPMNVSTRSFFPYNCDFTMTELKKALLQAHNTSPGLDRITYTMLRHLNPDSLTNILYLFNSVEGELLSLQLERSHCDSNP
ncbi:putative RNA-directed DNA polymerase from transposon X-element [Trichonephila clavipes]|nr:putative RNA-directed DNA polymerase from transposon X-element [Trichonephila clavipes]